MSRIGKRAIPVPEKVKININKRNILVEGPKGKLEWVFSPRVEVGLKDNIIMVTRLTDSKTDKTLQGTTRSIIFNMVQGVNLGYSKELEIVGVGFRAQISGKKLTMLLGYSHPIEYKIPDGITVETPKPNLINVKGINKQLVGEVAAELRAFFKPEPYKGKGIRYIGEYVRRKAGKAVA